MTDTSTNWAARGLDRNPETGRLRAAPGTVPAPPPEPKRNTRGTYASGRQELQSGAIKTISIRIWQRTIPGSGRMTTLTLTNEKGNLIADIHLTALEALDLTGAILGPDDETGLLFITPADNTSMNKEQAA